MRRALSCPVLRIGTTHNIGPINMSVSQAARSLIKHGEVDEKDSVPPFCKGELGGILDKSLEPFVKSP